MRCLLMLDLSAYFLKWLVNLNAATPDMVERPILILLHGSPGYDHSKLRPYFDRYKIPIS